MFKLLLVGSIFRGKKVLLDFSEIVLNQLVDSSCWQKLLSETEVENYFGISLTVLIIFDLFHSYMFFLAFFILKFIDTSKSWPSNQYSSLDAANYFEWMLQTLLKKTLNLGFWCTPKITSFFYLLFRIWIILFSRDSFCTIFYTSDFVFFYYLKKKVGSFFGLFKTAKITKFWL